MQNSIWVAGHEGQSLHLLPPRKRKTRGFHYASRNSAEAQPSTSPWNALISSWEDLSSATTQSIRSKLIRGRQIPTQKAKARWWDMTTKSHSGKSETTDLGKPHDDALVIRIDLGNYELSRIMIDTGSSADVLFYDAFKKMGHLDSELQGRKTPLTWFAGETTFSLGTIQLPTVARGVRRLTSFLVVDKKASFNAIIGRPWLHAMKVVPSTYHQCIKFPLDKGITVVYSSQRSSRKCYMGSYEHIKKADPVVLMIEDKLAEMKTVRSSDPSQRGPRKSLITQVYIDESDPKRCVGIGQDLDPAIRENLITFLKEKKTASPGQVRTSEE